MRALCVVKTAVPQLDHPRQWVEACEQTLAIFDILQGDTWQDPPFWDYLSPQERGRVAEDTRELLLLLAAARVHLDPANKQTLAGALALLDRAEAIGGLEPCRTLWQDRARYLSELGESGPARAAQKKAEEIPVASACDHYLLATALARKGTPENLKGALAELDEAIKRDPHRYRSFLLRGLCLVNLGKHAEAAGEFGTCIGLGPEKPWGYFNRGYVYYQCGHYPEALKDYTAALKCDSAFVPAYVSRASTFLEMNQYQSAHEDYARALKEGRRDPPVLAGYGRALEGLGRYDEADNAFKEMFSRAQTLPSQERHRLWGAYGFAVASRLPQAARHAFEEILHQDPDNSRALYGQAMLAMRESRETEAIRFFDRVLRVNPGFMDARRYRAVALAREDSLDKAFQDINWCLDKEPDSADTLYVAACVAALAAGKRDDAKLETQALEFLQKAADKDADLERARTDPDLARIRDHRPFKEILDQGKKKKR